MRVKNTKQTTDVWVGQTIASMAEYDIQAVELFKWQGDNKVISDLSSGDLLIGDGTAYKSGAANAVNFLLGSDTSPKDAAGRTIMRPAATIDGWHYQLFSVEITTADKDGFYCKDEDGNDVGFITHKIYDANGDEITDAANEGNAVKTCVWVRPTHHYEIIGAIFAQEAAPTTNIRLFATGLPGIYNIRFARGGINLRHLGVGVYQLTDGRASKYLAYNAQVADANSFKFTLLHNTGTQHTFMLNLELFKAP